MSSSTGLARSENRVRSLEKESTTSSPSDFARSEARARQVERESNNAKHQDAALSHTVKAIELYMQALQMAETAVDRRRIDSKCKILLTRAENIKKSKVGAENGVPKPLPLRTKSANAPKAPSSSRELTRRENIIILEGSKLNGFKFKPWERKPDGDEFLLKDGEEQFVDSPDLPLSEAQLESFAGWKRPKEALATMSAEGGSNYPTMGPLFKIDLVQDMTSDCSVVASLCAGISRAARGHSKILKAIIYPYDYEAETPSTSPSGKYVLRLYFNGCWRRVQIDDRLPTSNNSRFLHVIDRHHPGLFWPALVEKAYLKVRGGYDFPGSNSGTDLAVITGWIPEQVFLHDEDVEQESLWETIYNAFQIGDVLLTMGTGKLPRREQRLLGLAAEHDYAVLDMKGDEEVKEMLIKNPWSDGDVWRGATRRRPNPSQQSSPVLSPNESNAEDASDMTPGTFWMDFRSVFQHFENIYINWNPCIFSHRQDFHFTWDLATSGQSDNMFVTNPQFVVRSERPGTVWLLLNRHFRTGDYSPTSIGKNGYISLYLFNKKGERVLSSDEAMVRGPYVDSPNTLMRFDLPPRTAYTAVVASQDLSFSKYNFTISSFSDMSVKLSEAYNKFNNEQVLSAAWTRSTAGGNPDSRRYLRNPQFRITLHAPSELALILQIPCDAATKSDIHVKVLIVFTTGTRVTKLRLRDIMANSGDYRRGSAVVQTRLDKGSYTVICSTFEPDQLSPFTLKLLSPSSQSLCLTTLPPEGGGRLNITSSPAVFDADTSRLLAPLTIPRILKAIFILQPSPGLVRTSSLFKLTLEQGQGPYKTCLASSASAEDEFGNLSNEIRIEDLDLRPDMQGAETGGLWLVVERIARGSSGGEELEIVVVEILAEERIVVGGWGSGDG